MRAPFVLGMGRARIEAGRGGPNARSEERARARAPLTHTRTEGRAPLQSSEFTLKAATLQGDSAEFMPSP
jgi:hypothetical protein